MYIENFFSYKNKNDVTPLASISSFIGINNAGKSNILRTMQWYKNLLKNDYSSSDTQSKYHKKNDNKLFDFEIGFNFQSHVPHKTSYIFDDVVLTHFLRFTPEGKLLVEKLTIKKSKHHPIDLLYKNMLGKEPVAYFSLERNLLDYLHGSLPTSNQDHSPEMINLDNYEPFKWNGMNKQINDICKSFLRELNDYINSWFFFDSVRYIDSNYNPQSDYFPSIGGQNESSYDEMDVRGNVTSKFLESKHSAKPRDTINAMETIANIFDLKEIKSTKGSKWTNNINTFSEDKNEIESPIELMGSGFQQALIIAANILLSKKNRVFFIEEPESHLHPKAQREFLKVMRKGVKELDHQFFITTHSSIFSLVEKDDFHTFLVTKNKDLSSIRGLSKENLQEVKEILGYKNSDIFGYDAILFVEGETEEETLPLLGKILGIDIFSLGIGIFNSKTYGNMVHIDNLLNILESTGTKIFALYDSHENEQKKLKDIEEKIPTNRRTKLDTDFENCFSKDILLESLKNLIESKETEYSLRYQKLDHYGHLDDILSRDAGSNNLFRHIKKCYNDITGNTIVKVEFGRQIAFTIEDQLSKLNKQEKSLIIDDLVKLGPFKILDNICNDLKS